MALAMRTKSSVFFASLISALIAASCEDQRAVFRYHLPPFLLCVPMMPQNL
jgi:hypothetical protein